MTITCQISCIGQLYDMILSDEKEALLAAKAAGRASVGLTHGNDIWLPCDYAAEEAEDLTEEDLLRILQRKLALPWKIAETPRLLLRELTAEDRLCLPAEEDESPAEQALREEGYFLDYIRHQYAFYEYGLWAVTKKDSGRLIGLAGAFPAGISPAFPVTADPGDSFPAELGYHIFRPWRQKGYGTEAVRAVLSYMHAHFDCRLYARIAPDNPASLRLIRALSFHPLPAGSEESEGLLLFAENSPQY